MHAFSLEGFTFQDSSMPNQLARSYVRRSVSYTRPRTSTNVDQWVPRKSTLVDFWVTCVDLVNFRRVFPHKSTNVDRWILGVDLNSTFVDQRSTPFMWGCAQGKRLLRGSSRYHFKRNSYICIRRKPTRFLTWMDERKLTVIETVCL